MLIVEPILGEQPQLGAATCTLYTAGSQAIQDGNPWSSQGVQGPWASISEQLNAY